jgi:MoxR-like ATPase
MLPSDVLGVTIYNAHSEQFEFKPGPIFTNFLLADEINRTTPKTQSALLEAMNEQQISVEGKTLNLPDPFMVIATQNPAEHHGTYPLPESQLDRFLMRLRIGYPDLASEREIIRQPETRHGEATPRVLTREALLELQEVVKQVRVDDAIVDYMLTIVERTRTHEGLSLGVSPRGSQAFYRAVQACAVLEGRAFAVPDDAKILAPKVFGHRVVPAARQTLASRRNSNPAITGERIIEEILNGIEIPL